MKAKVKQFFRNYIDGLTLKEKLFRLIVFITAETFVAVTWAVVLIRGEYSRIGGLVGDTFLAAAPFVTELCFRMKMRRGAFIAAEIYSVGAMIGDCWKLYYLTMWWDKLLHTMGGVVVAALGIYVLKKLIPDRKVLKQRIGVALFAFSLSVTVAAVWEYVEYTIDIVFDQDMQHDSVVHEIHSYEFGKEPGTKGHIYDIGSVEVDGEKLPVDGYLDIGLIDTMNDMLVETAGALLVSVIYLIDKEKHRLFLPIS